jgi:hypothetical protein
VYCIPYSKASDRNAGGRALLPVGWVWENVGAFVVKRRVGRNSNRSQLAPTFDMKFAVVMQNIEVTVMAAMGLGVEGQLQ